MTALPHISRTIVAAIALAALAGCTSFDGEFLNEHMALDRKARANERWQNVRSGVKRELARKHLEAGRIEDAAIALQQALDLAGPDAPTQNLAARIHIERGELAQAQDAVQRAIRNGNADAESFYLAGIVAQRYGHLPQAAEHYAEAARRDRFRPEYVVAHAEALVALDRIVDAHEWINDRIIDFESSAPLRAVAARVCRMLGLREPAIAHAREASRLESDDLHHAVHLGELYLWAQRYDDAVDVFNTLLTEARAPAAGESAPAFDEHTVRVRLATALINSGNHVAARTALRPLLTREQNDLAVWTLFARASIETRHDAEAAQALDRARTRAPDDESVLLLTGYLALQQNRTDDAERIARRITDERNASPAQSAAFCLIARAAEQRGDEASARAAYAMAAGRPQHDRGVRTSRPQGPRGVQASRPQIDRELNTPRPQTDRGVRASRPQDVDHDETPVRRIRSNAPARLDLETTTAWKTAIKEPAQDSE